MSAFSGACVFEQPQSVGVHASRMRHRQHASAEQRPVAQATGLRNWPRSARLLCVPLVGSNRLLRNAAGVPALQKQQKQEVFALLMAAGSSGMSWGLPHSYFACMQLSTARRARVACAGTMHGRNLDVVRMFV